jgi:recombination protein RecA
MARARVKTEPATLAESMEGATRDRNAMLASVSGRFSAFKPAKQVLRRVRGVRTIFPSVDLATKIGGWPIERITLVHGESGEGKTKFSLGLGRSFLERGHFFALVDAEQTTEEYWTKNLGYPDAPEGVFGAMRPKTYEDAVDGVRQWAETIAEARAKGELPPDTSGICVVDSIGKLAPKDLIKKIAKMSEEEEGNDNKSGFKKKPKRGIDGMGGRAAQYKAALNNAWMNELVPLMGHTGCAMLIITREIEDPDAGMYDEGFKLTGGRSLFYDSSLVVRVVRDGYIYRGEGKDRELLGERHRVEIRKSKLGYRDQKIPRAFFHDSNGLLVPAGFDTARDFLDVGCDIGLVEQKGSYYWFGKKKLGQGEHAVVKALHDDPKLFAELEEATRASIDKILADSTQNESGI